MTTTPNPPKSVVTELLALSERATPGPWLYRYKSNSWHRAPDPNTAFRYGESIMDPEDDWLSLKGEDVEFVQALVNWFRSQDWTAARKAELPESGVTEEMVALGVEAYERTWEAHEKRKNDKPLSFAKLVRAVLEAVITDGCVRKVELPEEELIDDKDWAVYGYTADQMRAYAAESVSYWHEMWRAANVRAEGLEADARRYRWLRDQAVRHEWDSFELPWVSAIDYRPGAELNEQYETLDAAIDAAQAVRSEASEGEGS